MPEIISEDKSFISTTVSIFFKRLIDIRRKVFNFEDALKDKYKSPPIVTPVPDDIDPDFPRLSFRSNLGHSNINVSQINLSFNVKYDQEFERDYNKCEDYVLKRLKVLSNIK